jgi:hypothetical protein
MIYLPEGQQNEEDCQWCLPSCTQVTYNAQVNYAPLKADISQRYYLTHTSLSFLSMKKCEVCLRTSAQHIVLTSGSF